MRAEKGNKVYTITEKEKASYVADGFDIYDEDGKLIASGKGKTVSVEEYEKLKARNQELEAALAKVEKASDNGEAIVYLKAYAEEHGVDVGRASSISGIVAKLKEQVVEVPEGENPKDGE